MTNNIDKLSPKNFGNICRTCLSEGDMIPLYKSCSNDACLVEMLMSCTFVQFCEEDGLPEQICGKCIADINQAYKFSKQCEIVDSALRNCIAKFKNEAATINKADISQKTKETNLINNYQEKEIEKTNELYKNTIKIKYEIGEVETNNQKKINEFNETPGLKLENDYFDDTNDESGLSDRSDNIKTEYSKYTKNKKENTQLKRKRIFTKQGPPFSCTSCDITFENLEELQEHRLKVKHSRPRTHSCPVCQKQFTSWSLKTHMRTHTKERPFLCSVCGKGFSINRNLRRHMMIHTGERPHKCNLCEKAFIQLNTLQDHLRVHSGEKPFVCSICGVRYKQQAQLKLHVKKHTKGPDEQKKCRKRNPRTDIEPEHECPVCHKRYYTKPVLKQHMIVHGEKTFLCSDCGKGFYSKATLQAHSKVHTGLRPYSCEVCGKSFSHYGTLTSHNLIHTGEKPFSCPVCNKAFTQRNHVKYHMRTHSGERPYACSVCNKTFSLNGTLTVHMRTHTGETPYLCPICGKGFYDSSSMKKHKRGHGEQNT